MRRSLDDDPLTLAIAPPPNESLAEKQEREQAETEARRISDEIDNQIKIDKATLKKRNPIKVLLLGQSESGELPHTSHSFMF
jgi:hypothetical protein